MLVELIFFFPLVVTLTGVLSRSHLQGSWGRGILEWQQVVLPGVVWPGVFWCVWHGLAFCFLWLAWGIVWEWPRVRVRGSWSSWFEGTPHLRYPRKYSSFLQSLSSLEAFRPLGSLLSPFSSFLGGGRGLVEWAEDFFEIANLFYGLTAVSQVIFPLLNKIK